ncbi:hypothetical protein AAFF_G00012290 [Aldrovandia affinis]|uniref:Uncharacterized protein n=1 Tax=Aldrovandia affinis TaxID=143900 RepID=A0AAD7S8W1_9TELE|nr:hypothetical protein AAFF_G00012290 [Aldrovandia affinis]
MSAPRTTPPVSVQIDSPCLSELSSTLQRQLRSEGGQVQTAAVREPPTPPEQRGPSFKPSQSRPLPRGRNHPARAMAPSAGHFVGQRAVGTGSGDWRQCEWLFEPTAQKPASASRGLLRV